MIDTSEIITSKSHIEPLAEDGYIIYKLGYLSPVADGRREARMIWGNERRPNTGTLTKSDIPYDIDFEFSDFVLGTAKTYTLDLKAKKAYTIEGIILETDTGTLTGIAVKIGSTAVTSLSGLTAMTIAETASTGAKTVALGDRVTFVLSTGYTGTPTTVRGKLVRQLT